MKKLVSIVLFSMSLALAGVAQATVFVNGEKAFCARNYDSAYKTLLPLAKKGNDNAQLLIGFITEFNKNNLKKAVDWYKKSAELGNTTAQEVLGSIYVQGRLGKPDFIKGVEWYTKNAEAGDSSGQYGLGYAYHVGSGVEKNFNKAAEWYTKAAKQGHAWAQSNLGNLHAAGNGTPINKVKACKWWIIAANQGDKPAKENVKRLCSTISVEEMSDAKQLVKAFTSVESEATKKRRYRCEKYKSGKSNKQ